MAPANAAMLAVDAGIEVTNHHALAGESCLPKAFHVQALDAPGRTDSGLDWTGFDRLDQADLRSLVDLAHLRISLERNEAAGIHAADRESKVGVDAHAALGQALRSSDLAASGARRRRHETLCLGSVRRDEMILHRGLGRGGGRRPVLHCDNHFDIANRGQCILEAGPCHCRGSG
ncbi:hypothetical protein [Bradyrhizobium barranii]